MPTEVKAPTYPESILEGTLMTWYKQEGDAVQVDEKLADIETDKIVLEVAATAGGVLSTVVKKEGDTVLSGEVIATLDVGAGATPAAPPAPTVPETTPPPPEPTTPPPAEPVAETLPPAVSPAARKLLLEHELTAADVQGSGRGGRITKADVLAHLAPAPPAEPAAIPTPLPAAPLPTGVRPEERVAMTRIRARIAERLIKVQQTAAILTTFNEVDMKPVMDLRKKYRDAFEKAHGVRLGFMSFFVKAAIEALKRFPDVNASIDGSDIIYHGYFDIGVAVSSPRGLVVPILRDADRMSFAEIETAIADVAARAQNNQLAIEDLQGGTFSLTNGGIFGSMLSTPILNPPQSAILGMHAITERPVAVEGEVIIRPIMYLALSYDHRIVDGRQAVLFLYAIKEIIEDPARLLIQV